MVIKGIDLDSLSTFGNADTRNGGLNRYPNASRFRESPIIIGTLKCRMEAKTLFTSVSETQTQGSRVKFACTLCQTTNGIFWKVVL
jgi:hypothetical protein